MTYAADRFRAVILCILLLPLFVEVLCLVHILSSSTLCPSLAIILTGKRTLTTACTAPMVFKMSLFFKGI